LFIVLQGILKIYVAYNVHKNEKNKINHKIGRTERLVMYRVRCDNMINLLKPSA